MNDQREHDIRRLKSIERNISVVRMSIGILPLWLIGETLIRFSPHHMLGFGLAVLGLTAILINLAFVRLVMTTSFVGPEHRFFNDAKRIAAFIDRTRSRGYIPVYGPSELFKLKLVNLLIQSAGWGILLAVMLGGYTYIMDALSGGRPWPAHAGLMFKWGMPCLFVCFVLLAILNGVRTINSKDPDDFPFTRALLSPKPTSQ
jgi:hypothetical protein